MISANTRGFRLLPSYYEAIRELPDGERLALYDAIFDFGFGNQVEELPLTVRAYFTLMKPSIEKSVEFFERQKANSDKAAEKAKEKVGQTQNEPGAQSGKRRESDSDSDSEGEGEGDSDSEGESESESGGA